MHYDMPLLALSVGFRQLRHNGIHPSSFVIATFTNVCLILGEQLKLRLNNGGISIENTEKISTGVLPGLQKSRKGRKQSPKLRPGGGGGGL